jgi:hypothetical protein
MFEGLRKKGFPSGCPSQYESGNWLGPEIIRRQYCGLVSSETNSVAGCGFQNSGTGANEPTT